MKLRAFTVHWPRFARSRRCQKRLSDAVSARATIVRNPDGSYVLEIEVDGRHDPVHALHGSVRHDDHERRAARDRRSSRARSSARRDEHRVGQRRSRGRFTTDKPLRRGELGVLEVSRHVRLRSGCRGATLDGPIAVQCECLSFTARILPKSMSLFGHQTPSMNLGLTIFWLMNCSAGLEGCTGELELSRLQPVTAGSNIRLVDEKGQARKGNGQVHVRWRVCEAQPGHADGPAVREEATRREEPCEQDVHADAEAEVPGSRPAPAEVQARLRQARSGEQEEERPERRREARLAAYLTAQARPRDLLPGAGPRACAIPRTSGS